MANEVLSTSVDELAQIAVQEATMTFKNIANLSRYVTRRNVAPGQISARFPKWSGLTAAALTEGEAANNQAFTTSGQTLTPTTGAVARCIITDLAEHVSNGQTAVEFGRAAADAIIEKWNKDIWALFAGFSTGGGSTNTDISEAAIRLGVTTLIGKGARDIYLALTSNVLDNLWSLYTTVANVTLSDNMRDAIYRGEAPALFGARVVLVPSAQITNDGNGDVTCGLFDPRALGMATAWEVKVEAQRIAASVGWDLVASSAYAVGEIDDTYGYKLLVDA